MEETLFLKPTRVGDVVCDPISLQPLAADGEAKPASSYWLRRLMCGDVEASEDPMAGTRSTSLNQE